MAKYVLVNRRAGKYTAQAKSASRASIASVLTHLSDATKLADHNPKDSLARRVVVLEAEADEIAQMQKNLPADAMLEPLIQRWLHPRRVPIELKSAHPLAATLQSAQSQSYRVTVKGNDKPLAGIQVMFYLRDPGNQVRTVNATTDKNGKASIGVPPGHVVSFVEPIPYAGFWIMLAEAPPSGSTIDCAPIAKSGANGAGWWHQAMNVDVTDTDRGAGIRVGVIDTGCGPHPNLAHVTLVGAFVDGTTLPADQGTDVAEHGTHTSGIIGARPSKTGEYAGMAPGCDLFHARVFKSEEEGPSQADLINAIDALSRDHQCDLINMSLGGGPPSPAEEDAIRDAAERGTLCVCSAGNENGPIDFPGAYPECAAVSAIGQIGWAPAGTFSFGNRPKEPELLGQENLFLATFSCFGPTLACAGPGVGIVSTVPAKTGLTAPYMEMDGTSMASPAACGTLAAVLAKDPDYGALPRDISRTNAARTLLAQHCHPFGLAIQFEGRGLPRI